ncbi:MAG: rod shape-determining protein MreC [Candidatus Kerfeldbacteria bacterium]|nr:rod shape-determining protein MreC [Candidatus Kerfeldbacteria bacterium]
MTTSRSRRRFTLIVLVVAAAVVLLRQTPVIAPIESGVARVTSPVRSLLYRAAQATIVPKQSGDLSRTEEDALRRDYNRVLVESASLHDRVDELADVAEQLESISALGHPTIVARVIGRGLDANVQVLTINRGADDGLQNGAPVVADAGVLVGTITAVAPRTSTVLLIVDTQSSVSAVVQNDEQSPGVVEGSLGRSAEMRLVPQDEPVEPSMRVVTAGLEPGIPHGIVIGTIGSLISHEEDLFQTATLQLPVAFDRINVVTVLQPTTTP